MSKVPVLGDIPLFAELFRNTKTETERSTVIVFLAPTDRRKLFELRAA